MDLSQIWDTYMCLNFNEVVIILENIFEKDENGQIKKTLEKNELLIRLMELEENAIDDILRTEASSLRNKLTHLSEGDYERLVDAAADKDMLFPPNYVLSNYYDY